MRRPELTVDELEERLSAAYGAVTRADLSRLVADLPPLQAARGATAPVPAPRARTSSLFWLWALVPFVGAAAWVHAAFVTRSARYWPLSAVYAVPLVLAATFAPGAHDELPGWVSAIAIAYWIVNTIHAWMARPAVDAARRVRGSGRPAAG